MALGRRRQVSGDDCVRAAFPTEPLDGLLEAVEAVARAYPSAVVPVLIASLNPRHWRSSRSAVVGLGEQGRAALAAAPAVAGWLRLCVDHTSGTSQDFGINESLYRLTKLRQQLDEPDLDSPPEALDRIRRFFDEVFQPYLLTLLAPPVRQWQRGIIGYLGLLHGDLEAVAGALQRFTATLREHTWDSAANSDWDEYTHSETLTLIGELGPHLDRIKVEREWSEQWEAQPVDLPARSETSQLRAVAEDTVAWARRELTAPSVDRRRAACRVLRQLGPQAVSAVPALRSMLAQLDGVAPAAVSQLREEALMTMRAIEPLPAMADCPDDTSGVDADEAAMEAAERLLALATRDADPGVRTAALHAIADAGASIAGAREAALHAAAAEDPHERAAAARLLAMFMR